MSRLQAAVAAALVWVVVTPTAARGELFAAPGVGAAAAERPSAAWSPADRPSSAWTAAQLADTAEDWSSPEAAARYAAGNAGSSAEEAGAANDNSGASGSCFAAPPLAAPPAECHDPVRYFAAPPCDGWHVRSHFQPMLGRYGLVAPYAPGVESVHSQYLATPLIAQPPAGQCAGAAPLFAPPPGAGASECAAGPPCQNPCVDPRAGLAQYNSGDFLPDPFFGYIPWDSCEEQSVYGGKHLNPTQRPWVEWGMPLYLNGPVPPPTLEFGATNPSVKRFYVYGDYRAAVAYNAQFGHDQTVLANRLNLEADYWMTATERIHGSIGPLQEGNDFFGVEFDGGRGHLNEALDFFDEDTDTLFFEGDMGAMIGGTTGRYAPFDMPIAVGLIPLLFQNGVWMDDAIVGAALTIPARNSPLLDWSNYDVTFFVGADQLTTPAFNNDVSGNVFGVTTMIEAKGGYIEAGYAYVADPTHEGLSYNNVGLSYTRRYLNAVSNSMRVIVNAGQNGPEDDRTANGVLLLAENSFLTPWPYNVIPYFNLWSGFDDPQSVARAGGAGGVLRNTGILFESDNLTGYPTLDATGNDTFGAALGLDLLAPDFSQQLILEVAGLGVFGDPATRNAPGPQSGIGARYQIPISNATLLRFDVMHGWLENSDDETGRAGGISVEVLGRLRDES